MSYDTDDDGLRADARRNRRTVLDTAVALLAERPHATMQAIADASGLGRTTVYRHFPRRQDLVDALFADVLREAAAAIDAALRRPRPALELLRDLGSKLLAIGDRYRFLDAHPELRERALTSGRDIGIPLFVHLTEAQGRGELRADMPVTWLLTSLRGLAVVATHEVSEGRLTVEQAGCYLGTTLASAFAPQAAER